ncbi:MAG: hypothetical protein KKB76_07520 [Candidatus Omnitrophica bacterium]|nr:hypothetical protein [Candidatus Omnitrophota bacterium]
MSGYTPALNTYRGSSPKPFTTTPAKSLVNGRLSRLNARVLDLPAGRQGIYHALMPACALWVPIQNHRRAYSRQLVSGSGKGQSV